MEFNQTTDGTYAGVISGSGGLTKIGAGKLTLSGANTYSGGTTISAGTLRVENNFSSSGLTFNAGELQVAGGTTTWSSAAPGAGCTLTVDGGTLQITQDFVAPADRFNLNSGIVKVSGGTTQWNDAAIGTGKTVTVAGGTWSTNTIAPTSGGTVNLQSGELTVSGGADFRNGTFTFTGGTLNVGGTLLGVSTVESGRTVNLTGSAGRWDDANLVVNGSLGIQSGGILNLTGGLSVNNQVTVSGSAKVNGLAIGENGELTVNNGGTLELTGDTDFSTQAGTFTHNGGDVRISGGTTTWNKGSSGLSSTKTLTLDGGTLSVVEADFDTRQTGFTATSGGFKVNTGRTLTADAATINNLNVALDGGNVEFNQSTGGIYGGVLSGTGGLTKIGIGTLTLTGANTYTGGTVVTEGTLAGNTTSLRGDITNSASVEFNQSTDGTYAGSVSGTGTLTKSGNGVLTLTGVNTHSGGTLVSGGTLAVGANSALGDAAGDLILDDGTLRYDAGFTSARTVNLGAAGGTFDTAGNDAELSGTVSGLGSLTKIGAGVLTLSGNSTFMGTTDVQAGTLVLNGTSNADYLVDTGGCFRGNGTVHDLNNRGTVAPGNSIGTVTVTGGYTQNAGSTLEVEINDAGQTDLVDVTGSATINGGTVDVRAEAGNYTAGTTYKFLDADGSVTGTFDSIVDNLAFLDATLVYNKNDVQILLQRKKVFITEAHTYNQRAVAGYLDDHYSGATGDMRTVMQTLDALTAPQARTAFDSMSGELYGSLSTVGIENTGRFLRTTADRLRAGSLHGRFSQPGRRAATNMLSSLDSDTVVRGQCNCGRFVRPVSGWESWAESYGVGASIGGNGDSSGLQYSTGGLAVGLQRRLDYHTLAGVVGGYSNTGTTLDSRGDSGSIDSGQFALYLHRDIRQAYATGIVAYGYNAYDTRRSITIGNMLRSSEAAYDGNDFSFYTEFGRNFRFRKAQLQPYAGLQYIQLHQNGFVESGAQSVDLSVGGVHADSFRGLLGTRLLTYFRTNSGRLLSLEGRALWRHEFLDEARILDAGFAGQSGGAFVVNGVNVDRDAAILGTGLTFHLSSRCKLFANYDILTSTNYTAHTGTGGFSFVW